MDKKVANKIKLSICIPTYNRAEILYDTICSDLQYQGDDIEIVISDNCSPDNTRTVVSSIKDNRVKYFCNSFNNISDNLVTCLTRGTGDYLLLTSDEDNVLVENIDSLLDFLSKNEPAVTNCSNLLFGKIYVHFEDNVYGSGEESLEKYLDGCGYMSGYVFKRDVLNKVMDGYVGDSINFRFGHNYSFTNLAKKMLCYGCWATTSLVITDQRREAKRDEAQYHDRKVFAFSPEAREKCAEDCIDTIKGISISNHTKMYLAERYGYTFIVQCTKSDFLESFCEMGEKTYPDAFFGVYYSQNRKRYLEEGYHKRVRGLKKKYKKYVKEELGMSINYLALAVKKKAYTKKKIMELFEAIKFERKMKMIISEYLRNVNK